MYKLRPHQIEKAMKTSKDYSIKLTKKYKRYLQNNKLIIEFESFEGFTKDEEYILHFFLQRIENLLSGKGLIILPISKRYHLDFVGFNNEKYNDILICKRTFKL